MDKLPPAGFSGWGIQSHPPLSGLVGWPCSPHVCPRRPPRARIARLRSNLEAPPALLGGADG